MKPLKKSQVREFPPLAVFDIESTNWVNVQMICHVDEYGNRKSFTTIGDYLYWLLDSFEGDVVWAHFGSGYDNRFVVEELQKWEGSSYKAIMSGGLPIIFVLENERFLHTSHKNGKLRPKRVTLLDSFRLLPTALASIGKSIGVPKMEVDRSRIEKLSRKELSAYCFSDCDILLQGLQVFRDTIVSNGGSYAPTSASVASNFIRADPTIDWKKFYEPDSCYQTYSGESFAKGVPGSKPGMLQADEFSEGAYYGGRCEVFRRGCVNGPLYYYDIASAYPWAMRQPLPFYFRGFHPGAESGEHRKLLRILKSPGISEAYVTIPRGSFLIPPLPVRHSSGKVVFAEGRFHGRWTNAELLYLYQHGKKKGVRITVTAWARFQSAPFAKPFVDRFYALRKVAKDNKDDGLSMIYKILLNSCYGKLAQQLEQSSFVYGPAYEFMRELAEEDGRLKPSPLPGVSEIVDESPGPFRHVAAGAYVTALTRLKLLEGLNAALKHDIKVYYCDTDSLIVDAPIPDLRLSSDLGDWELEDVFSEAEFLCPKVYRAVSSITGKLILKAKGTNLRSQLELREPKERHDAESLLRWCVYARDISPFASQMVSGLTDEQMGYYGRVDAGLLGWRSAIRQGSVDCTVSVLERMARNTDTKRDHRPAEGSAPLYLTGENGGFLDVRTLDAETLIALELAEYDAHQRERIAAAEPEVYSSDG